MVFLDPLRKTGDAAIGHVELEREALKCVGKGRICPEHVEQSKVGIG
jgi:hypothetical protein